MLRRYRLRTLGLSAAASRLVNSGRVTQPESGTVAAASTDQGGDREPARPKGVSAGKGEGEAFLRQGCDVQFTLLGVIGGCNLYTYSRQWPGA